MTKDYQAPVKPTIDYTKHDLLGAVFYSDIVTLQTLNQLYPALL